MHKSPWIVTVVAVALACVSGAQADLVIDAVPVGNPGNAGELSGEGAPGDCDCPDLNDDSDTDLADFAAF